MSKMKVYELAKELDVPSKELVEFLAEKKIEVKNHMSALEDEEVKMVKAAFDKSGAETGKAPEKAEKPAGETPKKKNIVHVFRPQNTQNGARQGRRPAGGGKPGISQGRPMQVNNGRPAKPQNRPGQPARPGAEKARPTERSVEKAFEKALEKKQPQPAEQESTAQVQAQSQPQASGKKPADHAPKSSQTGRPNEKPQAKTASEKGSGERAAGERGRNDRNAGERGQRRGEDRGQNRGASERGQGKGGERNQGRGAGERSHGERRGETRRNQSSIPAPETPAQKPQRNKGKGKDDHKKKDYRREEEDRKPKGKKQKSDQKPQLQKPQPKAQKQEEEIKSITIPEVLTIKELADKMKVVPSVIVKKLFMQGKVVTVNQEIDYETAEEIALEFDVLCEKEEVVDVIEELLKEEEEDEKKMKKRPPVVCVMGHVDHGKTSLLDAIRHTNVIGGEAGGITQHIGAYVVERNGEKITFLDTPGHEAFTAMRMRGASSTDIAILVVAADDGVMPQTIEAINHAKAAGVEIIVAVNKIDKPSANVERVKQELTEYELIPEDWGGSTIFVPVSAKTGEGLDELMEMILLTAEVMELKANPNRRARGLVLEAELDKGRGPVATVLVQKGTLRIGDAVTAGAAHGKVRAMMDDKGRRVKEAGPSMPVEILGLDDVPNAGEVLVGCGNDKEARSFAETFISQSKVKLLEDTKSKLSLDDLFTQIQEGNLKELGIVVKADVQGSVEAIKQSLLKLSNDEVVVKIIHGGVGAINESDVSLASASNAIIIGFNVRPDATAKETAEREGVDIRLYRVIYNAIEDVEAAMKGMLDPVFEEKVLGHAEVRQLFKASGVGTIAGSYVLDGTFERDCAARIIRDGIVIYEGSLASLKRFKDDVKEVRAGYECGFVFSSFNDVKEGDQVEAFKMVEVPR